MTTTPITTSVLDLFKVRPGPSSSHTIGPMKATGRDMSTKYKETSQAGLALSATEC